MTGARLTAGLLAVLPAAMPLAADDRPVDQALEAFGRHAGYISATVLPCGGDEEEVTEFAGMVHRMLHRTGAGDEHLAAVNDAMARGRTDATPVVRDCTDTGGQELAITLMRLLDEVRARLHRRGE